MVLATYTSSGGTGRVNEKVAPSPSIPLLSTVIDPFMASTSCRVMKRPRPLPVHIAFQPDKLFKNDFLFIRWYAQAPVNHVHANHILFLPGDNTNGGLMRR